MEADLTEDAIEQQLQDHLVEHKASLTDIEEALACDPHNEELLEVHRELCAALKSAEDSLLHLKRNRLLREVDALESRANESKTAQQTIAALDTNLKNVDEAPKPSSNDPPAEECSPFRADSKCRFRHSDGRWYYGKIIEILESEGLARVTFLTPTSDKLQLCKFFLEQRCRFGDNCRMSHGTLIPFEALKSYNAPEWKSPSAGSAVLACSSLNGEGIWRSAEIETWNEDLRCGSAIFVDDGSRLEVRLENLCLSEYADVSDLESTSSEESDESEIDDAEDDCEEGNHLGLGNVNNSVPGPQTDTRVFANWEKHTRGVASKMMLNMGYREGMGLGKTGQGMVKPIQARVLPKGQSLDYVGKADEDNDANQRKKKKSRGGKRKRDKKFAEAARLAKSEEAKSSDSDVFGFINSQLYSQKNEDDKPDSTFGQSRSLTQSQRQVKPRTQTDDRRSLMAKADEIAELKSKVEKLQEMAIRNQKDKAVHEAVSRKLQEARKELADAEASHASASFAVNSKEKEKKWLKF